MKHKAGNEVDGWTLVSCLGRGGNSRVWRATHDRWGEAALKLLSRTDGDRWQRFGDEIAVMRDLGDHPGVLPLIDASLPDRDSHDQPWLAAPVAEEAIKALGEEPSLSEVVDAIHEYALTLANLFDRGIGHRDIKPANLFRFQGRWVVGDFGLAVYPGKQPVTVAGRRLGPLYFMAPEMLREPDRAESGPADVYSLAKTLWVLASGQRYPPEGQIRADVPEHSLGHWTDARGTLALGLLLEGATDLDPRARPVMAEFAENLVKWKNGGAVQDEVAAGQIRTRYVERIADGLAETLDETAFAEVEKQVQEALPEARRRAEQKRHQLQTDAVKKAERTRQELVRTGGMKKLLGVLGSAWIGSVRDGRDFAEAVLAQPVESRTKELEDARRILLGRPLWWLYSVVLSGCLRLRGQDGCEPIATELANEAIRNHLLEFPGDRTNAASWRLQRALIPAVARILAAAPLQQMEELAKAQVPAEERLRYNLDKSRFFIIGVSETVRTRLRTVEPWVPEQLESAADEAESMLDRLPVPAGTWLGPVTDPWLQSWRDVSPLLMCGLAILNESDNADDLLDSGDLRNAIVSATESEFQILRRPAVPLASRLGILPGT